jgi:TonB family protein
LVFSVVQSTGNAVLDHAGLEAIRSSAPFPPFPADFKKFSQLDIRMNFDYKAQYLPRKND